jgi:hypothetical protein
MSLQQALVWANVGQQLVVAGIATVTNIKTWIQAQHAGLSEADLNAILDNIIAGATRHKELADADAAGAATVVK